MSDYDFDFFVIGAGSGGVRAARIAAGHGARVGIAEDRDLGGTCVNVGCVPKKLLAYAAHFRHDLEDAGAYGWNVGTFTHDWARLIANKNEEISRLNGVYQRLLDGAGVELIRGRAVLTGPHSMQIGDREVTAERILIAVGGWPSMPDIPGADEFGISSNEAFYLDDMPERVVIVGGGYIAVEFAGIFHALGASVTLVHRGDRILRGFDQDLRLELEEELQRSGVDVLLNTLPAGLTADANGVRRLSLSDGRELPCDQVMFATGRRPKTAGLGLETAGVGVDPYGAVVVDDQYRTSVPNIYAIGDVTDRFNLTPVAIAEGHALADTVFGNRPRGISYENIPTAVFSMPPIGTVGLTEEEARLQFDVGIYRTRFRPMRHTLSGRQDKIMMKLIVDRASDRVLGCHMIGPDAPEIIQALGVAMSAGATKADFDSTIPVHPTAAEEFVTMRSPVTD
ncbi:glutathione-disulfide reductase [Fodinicurvata sp. EGI_FJ10296]|uniref:glutathione-disulfide reductase n=1 Tax=Fodinicurvata sp. EGI_FJ10296 TaxID=3231908 RepID=UPI0034558708